MKKLLALVAALAALSATAEVNFDDYFVDGTLRLDYIFAGNATSSDIYLEEMGCNKGWAGRRKHLDKPFLRGDGQIIVTSHATGDTIYANSFSTLFQEWQHTPEAEAVNRAFEATMLVPYPKDSVDVAVTLLSNRGEVMAMMRHTVDPADILIRHIPPTQAPYRYLKESGTPDRCVDIAIIAEGYTADETDKFYADAQRAVDAMFSHEPFQSMADRFNVVAVATVAGDSGPDVPREDIWQRTAHRSHYDTFYTDRYLTTQAIHGIFDSVSGLPVEHIILIVNTPRYGGGGIFNQMTTCSSDHPTFKAVLVHEFGHAYGGLADEYAYDDDPTYDLDIETWEPNITTLTDFASKWADMVPEGTPIPTPLADAPDIHSLNAANPDDAALMKKLTQTVGVFEGAGYRTEGIFRPAQECRMKVNEVEYFCPVCNKAIIDITDWYTR